MKTIIFSNQLKIFLQTSIILTILFYNFGVNGIQITYASSPPPPNDNFANAIDITNSLPFSQAIDTTGATQEFGEPDLTSAMGGCEGVPIRAGAATIWYKFAPNSNTSVFINTAGSTTNVPDPKNGGNYQYDTYVAVYTGTTLDNLTLIGCNDSPNNDTNQAALSFYALQGTTYLIQIAEYQGRLDQTYVYPGYNGGNLVLNINPALTISGNAAGLSGVKLSYIGGAATTNSNGDYVLAIPNPFTGKVTSSKNGYLFAPAIKAYTNVTTNVAGENYNLYSVSPADFNGDGNSDVAVFRASNNTWYISGQGSYAFGQAGDIPVPADYNGDGKADIAVFRPSTNTWYIQGQGSFVFGTFGDIPVVADYNGDGKADIAVFRPSNSTWYVRGQASFVYGTTGDIPVVADYNGDKKADIAVFRPSNSTWYIYGIGPKVYGTVGDIPVIADYDGDGKADIAVFRPSNSTWYIYGIGPKVYGTVGDIPAVGDYNGDKKADITVFRPSNSTWYKYGVGPSVYGTIGDIPV